jgi:RNA polymerase sigma factor (TIGR02999 family)
VSERPEPTELTAIFQEISNGAQGATERLFDVVYDELRRMAHGRMLRERPGQTLQTTALVNEAFLRLCSDDQARWENRRHFFGAAARAMRQILVDKAREKRAQKREGGRRRVTLDHDIAAEEAPVDLIALDEALDRLAAENERAADVVKHRYFLGLTVNETAEVLAVSPRTVDSDWQLAKAWLRREISRGHST